MYVVRPFTVRPFTYSLTLLTQALTALCEQPGCEAPMVLVQVL